MIDPVLLFGALCVFGRGLDEVHVVWIVEFRSRFRGELRQLVVGVWCLFVCWSAFFCGLGVEAIG